MKVPVGHQPTIELRNQPDFPAKQLAKDHARLQRCSRITVEPERDLPPICFGGSREHRGQQERFLPTLIFSARRSGR